MATCMSTFLREDTTAWEHLSHEQPGHVCQGKKSRGPVRRKQRCRVSKKKTKTKMQMQAHARLNCHVKYFHAVEGVGM